MKRPRSKITGTATATEVGGATTVKVGTYTTQRGTLYPALFINHRVFLLTPEVALSVADLLVDTTERIQQ